MSQPARLDDPNATTAPHDPGIATARTRADAVPPNRLARARARNGGDIRIGTASWTDPTILAKGVFYPDQASTPETRLRYYASRFPLVEVDSTYYALPTRRMAELWAERTPSDFVFDIKAHALMTGHGSEVSRLPRELREMLPARLASEKRVYAKDLPPDLRAAVWSTFTDALSPLRDSGKLGAVFLQFPPWFMPSRDNAAVIAQARAALGNVSCAVEFRNSEWLSERHRGRTMAELASHDMAYVMVDEPQGFPSSVPPFRAITASRLAVLRLHGRRADTWQKPVSKVSERYRYLYDRAELDTWVPHVLSIAEQVGEVHVVFNNCYGNYGTTNALEFAEMIWKAGGRE